MDLIFKGEAEGMNEIQINSTPARLEVNFEELRENLVDELKKYDVVVTSDTLKDAKQLATDLNKTAKLLDDRRKEEVAKASEPVRQFDEQMKELVGLCKSGRQKLLDQAKQFEDETRALALELLVSYRAELWEDLAVAPAYRSATVDDLAILSALTTKKNLTSKARGNVRARVEADKALQEQTERRILDLELESHRAGLAAPLQRVHVEAFLFADEETYRAKLAGLIEAEIQRQQAAERRERERIEREEAQRRREEAERQQREQAAEAQRIASENAQQAAGNGRENQDGEAEVPRNLEELEVTAEVPAQEVPREWVTVTAVFTLQVPITASNAALENDLRAKLQASGFKSDPKITVERLG